MSEEREEARRRTLGDRFGFDFDAFVAEARRARQFAQMAGDVLVAWNPDEENHYFHGVRWLAEKLPEFRKAPFAIVITHNDLVQLWTNYFDCWSSELIAAIFDDPVALPSDADPIPADPSPMHQPVPIPVPELDWQKKQQADQELIESNQKTREELKRMLGQ